MIEDQLTCKYHKARPIELCSTARKMILSSLLYWLCLFRNFSTAVKCVCEDSPFRLNSVDLRWVFRIWRQYQISLGMAYKILLSAPSAYQLWNLSYSSRLASSSQTQKKVAISVRVNDAKITNKRKSQQLK